MSLSAPIQPSATAVKTKAIGQLEIFTIVKAGSSHFIYSFDIFHKTNHGQGKFLNPIIAAQCNDNFLVKSVKAF